MYRELLFFSHVLHCKWQSILKREYFLCKHLLAETLLRNWKQCTAWKVRRAWREMGVRICERQLCMEDRMDCLLLIFWSLLYVRKCNGCLTWRVCNNGQGISWRIGDYRVYCKKHNIGLYIKLVETSSIIYWYINMYRFWTVNGMILLSTFLRIYSVCYKNLFY